MTAGTVTQIDIPTELRVTGTGISDRALRIQASGPVAIQAFAIDGEPNCGAFTVLPVPALGSSYLAVQYSTTFVGNLRYTQIAVVAAEAVTVTFQFPILVSVSYNGQVYPRDGDLTVSLSAFEVIQVQDMNGRDMSGTMIDASGRIAVFAGNVHVAVGDLSAYPYTDHVIEQMPPVETWGTTFGVVSSPNSLYGDRIKVVAKEDQTVFTVNGQEYTLFRATNVREIELVPGEVASIVSDKPILVAQFTPSRKGNTEEGMPSMLIVPPVQQYRSEYYFTVPDGDFDTELMIVMDSRLDTQGLLLDNVPLVALGPQWMRVPTTYYEGTVLPLSAGSHTLRHVNQAVRFGAFVFATENLNRCAFSYAAGLCLDDLTEVGNFGSTSSAWKLLNLGNIILEECI